MQRPAKFARAPTESALNAGSHPTGIVGVKLQRRLVFARQARAQAFAGRIAIARRGEIQNSRALLVGW